MDAPIINCRICGKEHQSWFKDCVPCRTEATKPQNPVGSALTPCYVLEDHIKAHDIVWGALVDAEAPLTDALKWAMDYLKFEST